MKYYTPSIEEFHVGFEFEYLLGSHLSYFNPDEDKEWGKYTFDDTLEATIYVLQQTDFQKGGEL